MEPMIRHQNHSDINYVIGYLNSNHAKAANEGSRWLLPSSQMSAIDPKHKTGFTGNGFM
nr:hypothetical protein [Acinetobacter baumannii]